MSTTTNEEVPMPIFHYEDDHEDEKKEVKKEEKPKTFFVLKSNATMAADIISGLGTSYDARERAAHMFTGVDVNLDCSESYNELITQAVDAVRAHLRKEGPRVTALRHVIIRLSAKVVGGELILRYGMFA